MLTDGEDREYLIGKHSEAKPAYRRSHDARTYRTGIIVVLLFVLALLASLSSRGPWSNHASDELEEPHGVTGESPFAKTLNGSYAGIYLAAYDQDHFYGIPYAKAPVGDLRFRRPQPIDTQFNGTRDAKAYGYHCVGYGPANYKMSEDCLTLNVIRPHLSNGKFDDYGKLPVLFWLHGGGFTLGSPENPVWNFSAIVQESVVIKKPFIAVSINYRLSAWGFLAGNEVAKSGDTNLGLRDQRLALEWIHENIGAFGGDPNKITISGQSAGAISVGYHMTAYGGRDDHLFRAGIMQSGSPVTFNGIPEISQSEPHFKSLVSEADCADAEDSLTCLRNVPFATLNAAIRKTGTDWRVVLDGDFIQKQVALHLAAGEYVHVPIISGANTDEGTTFCRKGIDAVSDLISIFASREPSQLQGQLLEAYPDDPCQGIPESMGCERPGPPLGSQYRRAAAFVGDYLFIANRRLMCRTWAKAGLPAYCYRHNALKPGTPLTKGVAHSEELPFVFGSVQGDANQRLAKIMGRYWASFVVDLDPNTSDLDDRHGGETESWPRYDDEHPKNYLFQADKSTVEDDTFRSQGIDLIISSHAPHGR